MNELNDKLAGDLGALFVEGWRGVLEEAYNKRSDLHDFLSAVEFETQKLGVKFIRRLAIQFGHEGPLPRDRSGASDALAEAFAAMAETEQYRREKILRDRLAAAEGRILLLEEKLQKLSWDLDDKLVDLEHRLTQDIHNLMD